MRREKVGRHDEDGREALWLRVMAPVSEFGAWRWEIAHRDTCLAHGDADDVDAAMAAADAAFRRMKD